MNKGFEKYFLKKISNYPLHKKIILKKINTKQDDNPENESGIEINIHRLALLGKDDEVLISKSNREKIFVTNTDSEPIPISPCYNYQQNINFARQKHTLTFKELESESDVQSYNFLSQFHYRTSQSDKQKSPSNNKISNKGGRSAVILCYMNFDRHQIPVGYIQLHQGLMMNKPRHILFDHPFQHSEKDISWSKWDQDARSKYINLFVRIGRVVTDPEFRGIGISRYLIQAAKKFSIERWHVRGVSPLFLEITAEMLKYIDFVSSSGFHFIGQTEGNLKRITSDLKHIEKVVATTKITGGILSAQKKYLDDFIKLSKELDLDWKEQLKRLTEISKNPEILYTMPIKEMLLFRSVIRLPIPHYILGLDNEAERYLNEAIRTKDLNQPEKILDSVALNPRIEIIDYNINSRKKIKQTENVRKIVSAFGIGAQPNNQSLIRDFNFTAKQGSINFIWGPSGSGKSVLLESLDSSKRKKDLLYDGEIKFNQDVSIGWLKDIRSKESIIDYFSSKWSMEEAMSALNRAGMSEASLFLKPYNLLSTGQKYRARIAKLILEKRSVWFIDEFCADLDPMTAKIISVNISKYIRKNKLIGFFAAANYQHFIDALNPNSVIILKQGLSPRELNTQEFNNEFHR